MTRRPRLRAFVAALAAAATIAGCTANTAAITVSGTETVSTATSSASTGIEGGATVEAVSDGDSGDAPTSIDQVRSANATPDAADTSWDATSATSIALTGSSAAVTGSGATVSADTVTITAGGTYVLSGTLNGQVVVNSATGDEVKLVLNGATITSSSTSAIAFTDAGEAVVVLADGTTNTLTDASTYADTTTENAPNAALFSAADLTIGGTGTLLVNGRGNDGITSKDGLVIAGGTITVTAADDGIRGKDHVAITGGTVTVKQAGGDGIKSDNDTDADSGFIDISGGTVTVTAADDGLQAATDVTSSDDGLNVSAGSTSTDSTGTGTAQNSGGGQGGMGGGEQVIDAGVTVSGGTIIAVGSASMPVAPDTDSKQGWLMANVSGKSGAKIQILSGTTVVAEFTATRDFGNIVYSGSGVTSGQQYTVSVAGAATTVTAGQASAGGMGRR